MPRRTEIPLTSETLRLVVWFDEEGGRVALQIERLWRGAWEFESPAFRFPAEALEAFRGRVDRSQVTMRHEKAPGPLEIVALRGGMMVHWQDVDYRISAEEFAKAISPYKPVTPDMIGPPRAMVDWSCAPEEDAITDFREIPVQEGVTLRVEKRQQGDTSQCWVTVEAGTNCSGRLLPFDPEDWGIPYKWLTTGGVAIQRLGPDRIMLYSHGNKKQGELKLSDLCAAILAMGGEIKKAKVETLGEVVRGMNPKPSEFVEGGGGEFWEDK